MHEGPEEPNQFEDFKTKCRKTDTRQVKDTELSVSSDVLDLIVPDALAKIP